jgi:hypothetical protein
VGFGGGGNPPATHNDGVTDPAPDDDVNSTIGREDDPLAGGNPALKPEAGDGNDRDDGDDDDGPPEFSFARSRLQQAIDDGDVDLDGPDLPGHLAVDPD